jgi:thiol-disulfide isomerase/thioredoxin
MKTLLLTAFTLAIFCLLSVSVHASSDDNFALGVISESQLLNDFSHFNENFQEFSISEQEQGIIAQWPATLQIDVYFGTWCHDSEREVPKLLKLLKANKHITSTLIALDYQKEDPEAFAKGSQIKYTPTFIVYRDKHKKEELGRIIERPNKTLVEDINQLLL